VQRTAAWSLGILAWALEPGLLGAVDSTVLAQSHSMGTHAHVIAHEARWTKRQQRAVSWPWLCELHIADHDTTTVLTKVTLPVTS
jgi:hypothetical protein